MVGGDLLIVVEDEGRPFRQPGVQRAKIAPRETLDVAQMLRREQWKRALFGVKVRPPGTAAKAAPLSVAGRGRASPGA